MNEALHTATYCPEDNKLRFYPDWTDADFDKEDLKAAGYRWASKQECYVCPRWTPKAEDIALAYCGEIGDEDYSPEERAADRAERFSGYRDKRRSEATSSADAFEAGPSVYGHQNAARAERQSRKHDRKRVYAVSQWSKAEYWQQRTEGVISNALYKSSPEVRRSRLLRLETEQRKYGGMSDRWQAHYELRIGYEKAMLENEGGRANEIEMIPGGWLGSHQIEKVNKSNATGRVVSVKLVGHRRNINIERAGSDVYREPTAEELEAFHTEQAEKKKAAKAAAPKKPSLINPTPADAERLQALWNAEAKHPSEVWYMTQAEYSARSKGGYSACETVEITERLRVKRASWGSKSEEGGRVTMFKIRKGCSSGMHLYAACRVVCITDKPQKALPFDKVAEVLESMPSREKMVERIDELKTELGKSWADKADEQLIADAAYCGLAYRQSQSQFGWTEAGYKWLKEQEEKLQTA